MMRQPHIGHFTTTWNAITRHHPFLYQPWTEDYGDIPFSEGPDVSAVWPELALRRQDIQPYRKTAGIPWADIFG